MQKYKYFLQFKSATFILYTNKGRGFNNLTNPDQEKQHFSLCISKRNKRGMVINLLNHNISYMIFFYGLAKMFLFI